MRYIFLIVFLVFVYSNVGRAFTLVPSRAKFPVTSVNIVVAGNSCANNGLSPTRLLDLAVEAMDEYWNTVPTTAMKIKSGGVDASINVSADTLSAALGKAPTNTILIGCNSNTTIFDDATILGVGTIGQNSSGHIAGTLLLNDALVAGANHVASMVDHELRAVLAHEVGHAIGIGHSGNPIALMYYSIGGKTQERLTQDDYAAITYLYPRPQEFVGGCGQITDNESKGKSLPYMFTLGLGFFLAVLLRRQNSL